MDIHKIKEIHCVHNLSKEDFINKESLLNGGKTSVGDVQTLVTTQYKCDDVNINDIDTIFFFSNTEDKGYKVLYDVVEHLKRVNSIDWFPIEDIDTILTAYVNYYLKFMLGTKISIDGFIEDMADCISLLETKQGLNYVYTLECLANLVLKFFSNNYENREFIKSTLSLSKVDNLYTFPYIIHTPVCLFRGPIQGINIFKVSEIFKQYSGKTITCDDGQIYNILTDIYLASETFRKFGFIEILSTCRLLKISYKSLYVYYLSDKTFKVVE